MATTKSKIQGILHQTYQYQQIPFIQNHDKQ